MKRTPIGYATVPRLLPNGGTVLVMGSGPSLNQADVDFARSQVHAVIAVNDSYKLAPDATALYSGDGKWWGWHKGCVNAHTVGTVKYPAFTGQLKYALTKTPWYPDVQILRRGPQMGLTLDPAKVALGHNSVYQAMNIAVHFGATRIALLGVDMRDTTKHFFGKHPDGTGAPVVHCLNKFATLVEPLRTAGVEVVNCTPKSALQCFQMMSLSEAFGIREQVAV